MAAVMDGALRAGPLVAVPEVLRELGQDPAAVLTEAGLAPGFLDDPENNVGFDVVGRLLELCVARTGCAHFGLRLGQKGGLDSLGLVGLLGAHSLDVGTALRNIILNLHLHDRGAIPVLSVVEGRAQLGYVIYQPAVEATAQIYDAAMVIIDNLMRSLVGPSWQPQEVSFAHVKPADSDLYRRIFRAPVRFNAEFTSLAFPAAWLGRPVPGADPAMYRALMERIATIDTQATQGGDIVDQVRRVLYNLLLSGSGDLDSVAEVFNVDRRTLNRRLRGRGITFRELLGEVRRAWAQQLLRDSDVPVVSIAAALGYTDPAAFTRAFRRWCQTTPSAWRAARG